MGNHPRRRRSLWQPVFEVAELLEGRQLLSGTHGGTIDSNAPFLETHHDRVPNFALNPTVTAIADGNWSDGRTWSGGTVPTTGDIVQIPHDTTVTYDAVSSNVIEAIGIKGHLEFATNADSKLTVLTVLVYPEGSLEIGSAAAPIAVGSRAEVVIADQPFDLVADPEQFGHGIIGFGKVRIHGAQLNRTFERIATELLANDTALQLQSPVTGWRVGDELYVPDTRHLRDFQQRNNYQSQGETRSIAAISPDGRTITLDSALTYDHLGARDQAGNLDFTPHVGNFGRNVLIRSENPLGITGHTMYLARADVDIRYAEFRDMGRTTTAPLDNTTFDGNGDVTHIGTNQIARYAVHAHHLIGPQTPQANGHQYTIVGNSFTVPGQGTANGANVKKWGITIHGSHYGLIQGNVLRDIADAGIAVEDGNESYNLFERNFVASGWSGKSLDQSGGIWMRGFNNLVRDNVVANMYTANVHSGYGFTYSGRFVGNKNIPAYQGADPHLAGQFLTVDMNGTAIPEFSGNEVYGSESGMTIWWLNQFGGSPANTRTGMKSVISDFKVWNVYRHGYFGYETHDVMFDGFTARGDASLLTNVFEQNSGWYSNDYFTSGNVIRNADIQGMRNGVQLPSHNADEFRIEDSYLRNDVNVHIRTPFNVDGAHNIQPHRTIIRNTVFDAVPTRPLTAIKMQYQSTNGSNDVVRDEVLVLDYQGNSGDDFQIFYDQQDPNFITPQTGENSDNTFRPNIGSPVAGLTNQQNWDTYGLSVGGAVAPVNDLPQFAMPELLGGMAFHTDAVTDVETGNSPPVLNFQQFPATDQLLNGDVIGTIVASDPDVGDSLLYAVVGGNTNDAFALHPTTGVLTVDNAAALTAGTTFRLSVYVTDNGGLTTSAEVLVIVASSNSAPVVEADKTIVLNEDDPNIPLDIPAPTDVDNDPLTITVHDLPDDIIGNVVKANGDLLAIGDELTIAELTALEFDSVPNAHGFAGGFRYDVTDGIETVSQTVSFMVNAVNDSPVIDSLTGPTTGVPGQTLSYEVVAHDVDSSITLTWTVTDADLNTVTSGTGTTLDFVPSVAGQFTVTVVAEDQFGLVDSRSLNVNVTATVVVDGTLYIGGTDGDDHIRIKPGRRHKWRKLPACETIEVRIRTDRGRWQKHIITEDVDRVVAFGLGGNDDIKISGWLHRLPVEFHGGEGNDVLTGGKADDIFFGGAGNDVIFGRHGNDTIFDSDGNNYVHTGHGDDVVQLGAGNDVVRAGHGDNEITIAGGNNKVFAGHGDNVVQLGSGNDRIHTGNGDDHITIDGGDNVVHAGHGKNIVQLGAGNDVVRTGHNDDEITISGGDNQVFAGHGDNIVRLGAGNDHVHTGHGDNIVRLGAGNDHVHTGHGDDLILLGAGNDKADAGDGNNIVVGGDGSDVIRTGRGRDVIIGGADTDVIFSGWGDDILIGGTTDHDTDESALNAIRDEWTSRRRQSDRVDNLTNGGGLNGTTVFDNTTVNDDSAVDVLFADLGDDWLPGLTSEDLVIGNRNRGRGRGRR